jgi:hypothetical protein
MLSDDSDATNSDSDLDEEYETDLTSEGKYKSENAKDLAELFADNEHPPEYYIQQLETFDETIYTQEDYRPGTTLLLDRVKKQWIQ